MKLVEILDPIDTSKQAQNIKDTIDNLVDVVKAKELGAGAYGVVYTNPNDPGTVTKVSRGMMLDDLERGGDAYLQYITELAKFRELTGNPYLPRIYSIKFYNDQRKDTKPWQRIKYVVELEKLQPLINQKLQQDQEGEHSYKAQVLAMADKMFSGFEEAFGKGSLYDITNRLVDQFKFHLGVERSSATNPEFQQLQIKDKNLKQAFDVLQRVKNQATKRHVFFDINAGNLMIRRTPYGLQLVITDPLA
jgi:hypothetical protein